RGPQGAPAPLVLSAAATAGQSLDASLVTGTTVDAELSFYPGAPALRALVAQGHGTVEACVPPGATVAALLADYAAALADDPWLDTRPAALSAAGLPPTRAPPKPRCRAAPPRAPAGGRRLAPGRPGRRRRAAAPRGRSAVAAGRAVRWRPGDGGGGVGAARPAAPPPPGSARAG